MGREFSKVALCLTLPDSDLSRQCLHRWVAVAILSRISDEPTVRDFCARGNLRITNQGFRNEYPREKFVGVERLPWAECGRRYILQMLSRAGFGYTGTARFQSQTSPRLPPVPFPIFPG